MGARIFVHFGEEGVSAVQGHPRSLTLVPIESAYATSYCSGLATGAALQVIFFCVVRPGRMTPDRAGVVPRCVVSWLSFYTPKVTLDDLENLAIPSITNMSSKIVY